MGGEQMARPLGIEYLGACYHVVNCCNQVRHWCHAGHLIALKNVAIILLAYLFWSPAIPDHSPVTDRIFFLISFEKK